MPAVAEFCEKCGKKLISVVDTHIPSKEKAKVSQKTKARTNAKMLALKDYLIIFLISAGYIAFVVLVIYGLDNNPFAWLFFGGLTCIFFIESLSLMGHGVAQAIEFTAAFSLIFIVLWLVGVPLWLMVILASIIGIFIVVMRRWS